MTAQVTGGHLHALWHVAKVCLPTVENVYIEQMNVVHELDGEPDTDKFGSCHPDWVGAARYFEKVLHFTAQSLQETSNGVIEALNAFQYVDGDNAKGLNDAGRELAQDLEEEQKADPSLGPVDRRDYGPAAKPNSP